MLCSDRVNGIQYKKVTPGCMSVIVEYCKTNSEDPGCAKYRSKKIKLQKIRKFKRTKLQQSSDLPSKKGRYMSLDFPESSLQDDLDIVISELDNADITGTVPTEYRATAIGNIINLMPHGQVFDACVTLEVPYEYTGSHLNVALLKAPNADSAFDVVPGTIYEDLGNGLAVSEHA